VRAFVVKVCRGLAATHQLELDKLQSRLTSSYNELKSARAEHDLCKRSHAMERAQLKKCEADLRLASGNAAQAERAHDEMRQEKDRLSRVNSQLAGERLES
jgi:peptidoglycan hydrolase CwlO-like protein